MTTINLQVGASSDDADVEQNDTNYSHTRSYIDWDNVNDDVDSGGRFTSVTIPPGSTIDSALPQVYNDHNDIDDLKKREWMELAVDAVTFSGGNDPKDRTRTSTNAGWFAVHNAVGLAWRIALQLDTEVQEVIDQVGWASGNAMSLNWEANTGSSYNGRIASYDGNSSLGMKLDITYTAPVPSVTVMDYERKTRGVFRGMCRGFA